MISKKKTLPTTTSYGVWTHDSVSEFHYGFWSTTYNVVQTAQPHGREESGLKIHLTRYYVEPSPINHSAVWMCLSM